MSNPTTSPDIVDSTTPANVSTDSPTEASIGKTTGDPTDVSTDATTYPPTSDPVDSTMYPSRNNDYDYNDDDYYDYDYYDYDYLYFGGLEETKEQEYQIEEAIRAELALRNDSEIVDMGHQFEDLVFECSFRGYDCRYVILPSCQVEQSIKRVARLKNVFQFLKKKM